MLQTISDVAGKYRLNSDVDYHVGALKGFKFTAGSLPSTKDAVRVILYLIYGDNQTELQSWENFSEMPKFIAVNWRAKIQWYWGIYLVSARRIRDVIEHKRKYASH